MTNHKVNLNKTNQNSQATTNDRLLKRKASTRRSNPGLTGSAKASKSPTPSTTPRPLSLSRLSSGPKNPQHKTFCTSSQLINDALCAEISKRRINIKAKEIYTAAGVTSPTFYLHYRNSNEARAEYERELERLLYHEIPSNAKSRIIYIHLTSFIAKNQNYFLATAKSGDHYLISKIINSYRHRLVGKRVSDRAFFYYVGFVVTSINCWLELDGITPETTKACSDRLAKLRPVQYWR